MDIRKLQRVIVDALEDVKAQDIKVFNTTHLTELFDRTVIASGTSNRQTKALAASVRDAVKEAGGHIIAVEGEDVGEWVLVDCGDAVVHIMQPQLRQYYNLEEIWGDKPVRIELVARASAACPRPARATTTRKTRPKRSRRPSAAPPSRSSPANARPRARHPPRRRLPRRPPRSPPPSAQPAPPSPPRRPLPRPSQKRQPRRQPSALRPSAHHNPAPGLPPCSC